MPFKEKDLPSNIEAEQALLGSLIIDPEATPSIRRLGLSPRDFRRDAHHTIYETILALDDAGIPADLVTLCNRLEEKSKLEAVRGAGYITGLINCVPTSGNAEYYANIILSLSLLRQYIDGLTHIVATAYEGFPVEEVQKQLEEFTYKMATKHNREQQLHDLPTLLSLYVTNLETIHERIRQLSPEERERGVITGVPMGLPTLDHFTGGLRRGDLITFAGITGSGKTSFLLTCAYQMAKMGLSVAFFSLEMPRAQLVQRLLSMDTGVDGSNLLRVSLSDDDWTRIAASIGGPLGEAGIWISDTPIVNASTMRSLSQWLKVTHGVDIIMVDYLQLMQASITAGRRIENRVLEVTEISHQLKWLATDLDVPVLAAAQLSRAVMQQQKKIPDLSMLRESGSIEHDSSMVLFLYREDMDEKGMPHPKHERYGITTVILAKNRHGGVSEFDYYYHAPRTLFMETSDAAEQGFIEWGRDSRWYARRLDRYAREPEPYSSTEQEWDDD